MEADTGAVEQVHAVGIKDDTPSDWGPVVRDALNKARRQLRRDRCNIVCVEVADMANFVDAVEIDRVFEAADRFLANDTRRVSGVIVTSIGAINYGPNQSVTDGPVRLRTASRSWLIRNPAPYIELPHGFDAPPFDRPEVRVQASSSKMGESGLQPAVAEN